MSKEGLNILHINIQSLRNKLDEPKLLLDEIEKANNQTIHIVALSEIWLYENENKFFNLDNYHTYFQNRQNNRSGGCCMFVHNSVTSSLYQQFNFEESSFITIKLNNFDIFIACVYKCCNSSLNPFIEKFESELLKLNKYVIIGDMNINLKNCDHDATNYIDTIQSNGALCLNSLNEKYFTRKNNSVNTFIDHIITNQVQNKFNICYIDSPISDHRILSVSIDLNNKQEKVTFERPNIINVFDYEKFENEIEIFDAICQHENFSDFHRDLVKIIKNNTKEIKQKNIKIRNEWANEDFVMHLKKRNKYFKLKTKNQNNENYTKLYKEYSMKVNKLKTKLKNKYYAEQIKNNVGCNRKLWNVLNHVIFNKNREKENIKQISINEKNVTDKTEMANAFNDYFININEQTDCTQMPEHIQYDILNNFKLHECNEEEIEKIINNLNDSSSNGYDNVSAKLLKKYVHKFKKPLCRYINHIFNTGIYPKEMKIGCVIPVHKKGRKQDCSNYRPITKLSNIDKIIEETIVIRLKNHLNVNSIINKNQFGFVDQSNTMAAAINITETIYEKIDKKNTLDS